MNQKTYLGASYLDVAKVAIETFLKVCRFPYIYYSIRKVRLSTTVFKVLISC